MNAICRIFDISGSPEAMFERYLTHFGQLGSHLYVFYRANWSWSESCWAQIDHLYVLYRVNRTYSGYFRTKLGHLYVFSRVNRT